jgi:hypothetical protein
MIIKVKKISSGLVIESISEKTILFKVGEVLTERDIYLASQMKDVKIKYSERVKEELLRIKKSTS